MFYYINGEFINGSSITTDFEVTIPNQPQDFEIILYIDDNSGGCPTYDIQTLTIPPTQFVVLDTVVPSWHTYSWNSEINAFIEVFIFHALLSIVFETFRVYDISLLI